MPSDQSSRREFLREVARNILAVSLVLGGGALVARKGACLTGIGCRECAALADCAQPQALTARAAGTVWQVDPYKCIQCGKCATECVLKPSAVKCVHGYAMCGYCKLCFGFFESEALPERMAGTAAEFQRCPVDAIVRTYKRDPYYQYDIREDRCIGCGICVKGCGAYGNGSLFLQIRHDRCMNCNECSIAAACPAQAIRRVPVTQPYLMKSGFQR